MNITGKHLINGKFTAEGVTIFNGSDALVQANVNATFYEATESEVNQACSAAGAAFTAYKKLPDSTRADFLESIAKNIESIGDQLIEVAQLETGLPSARLIGERGRTTGQLRLFAQMLREGSWVNAVIDLAQPDRSPLPKADIRMMQVPLGAVAVFGASNFPLAFSVAGGDTVSALAAGCTVVFKAHPAHPATCELVANAILEAIDQCKLPCGTFNMIQSATHQVGAKLVQHDVIKAVGFTGSFNGGKSIFDLANQRKSPIPVFAEMGSVNPVIILPKLIAEQGESLSVKLAESITMGVGQFCTNPGLVIMIDSNESRQLLSDANSALSNIPLGPMLSSSIKSSYLKGVNTLSKAEHVVTLSGNVDGEVKAHLFSTNVAAAMNNTHLIEEVFGPCSMAVLADDKSQLLKFISSLEGQLTASIFGNNEDIQDFEELINLLQEKVGRINFNNFPTGVEVTHAMVHGGPFPATTDARSTSVGTTSIYRFTRPICFQNCPDEHLPAALKAGNPLKIIRKIDNTFTQD